MGNFIIGLILGISGFYLVKEAFYINKQLLFVGWAERKWGPGSGTTFYQFFGMALMIFALFVAVGTIDVFNAAFGSNPGKVPSAQTTTPTVTQTNITNTSPRDNNKQILTGQIAQ